MSKQNIQTQQVKQFINKKDQFMQIFVKSLDNKTLTIGITKDSTVSDLKYEIQNKLKLKASQQNLVYEGKSLKYDHFPIQCYGINNESTLHLSGKIVGGCCCCCDEDDDKTEA
mmetsp:Transcript_218/g.307  ORF Transcript_218/g.307 Transcript_218/m.307 type:complete len:113 (+) Transcript_218:71-409(+)